MTSTWTKKYQPKSCDEVANSCAHKLKEFIKNYKPGKAAIIHGPTGSGKTCAVYALANELNYEIIEVNASDIRNSEAINSVVGHAAKQMSLFKKGKIILIDELDGISGNEDRGGVQAITQLITESNFPMILTANDPWNKKFSTLRRKVEMIEFSPLETKDLLLVLKRICDSEGISYDEADLMTLARRAGGDLRGAIIDLEVLASDSKKLTQKDIDQLSARNITTSIKDALFKIFKTTDLNVALSSFDNINENLNDCFLWIDENLPKEYKKPEDLARAYETISRADVFNGRIRRWQYWRFLVYVNALLSAGVAVAKDQKYKQIIGYSQTKRLLKLWIANARYQRKKQIASKLAEKTHTSEKVALQYIPYLQIIIKNNNEESERIIRELRLDKEEIDWLKK